MPYGAILPKIQEAPTPKALVTPIMIIYMPTYFIGWKWAGSIMFYLSYTSILDIKMPTLKFLLIGGKIIALELLCMEDLALIF